MFLSTQHQLHAPLTRAGESSAVGTAWPLGWQAVSAKGQMVNVFRFVAIRSLSQLLSSATVVQKQPDNRKKSVAGCQSNLTYGLQNLNFKLFLCVS